VINASSRDVYRSALAPSEAAVTRIPNGYVASKLSSKALVSAFRHTRGVSIISIRLANVYGPMDSNRRVIPIFTAQALAGEELTVYGQAKLLDFVHIDDICNAILIMLSRTVVLDGRTINLGSGTGTPLSEVATYVSEAVDACLRWRVSDDREGGVGQYVSDLTTVTAVLDFNPDMSLEAGLTETIEWYRNHPALCERLLAALK
jgi:dTDP-glucose 4,6-dehydratase